MFILFIILIFVNSPVFSILPAHLVHSASHNNNNQEMGGDLLEGDQVAGVDANMIFKLSAVTEGAAGSYLAVELSKNNLKVLFFSLFLSLALLIATFY